MGEVKSSNDKNRTPYRHILLDNRQLFRDLIDALFQWLNARLNLELARLRLGTLAQLVQNRPIRIRVTHFSL